MPETHNDALQVVRDLIQMIGGHCWAMTQSGKVYGSPGVADLYCLHAGRPLWIEVKVGRDKLSADQAAFKLLNEQCNVPVIVGRACDVVDFLGL